MTESIATMPKGAFKKSLKPFYTWLEAMLTGMGAAELAVLDGVVAGTVSDGKAVVPTTGGIIDAIDITALKIGSVALLATALEINRTCDVSTRLIAAGSTLAVTVAAHDGKTICLDTASGSVVTLPTAAGTGAKFRFLVSVTATSNSHKIQAGAAADIFYGSLTSIDTDTADATLAWAAQVADAFDTITFNRGTTGLAEIGDWVQLEDIGTNKWMVTGVFKASGTVATPFTSAV